MLNVGRRRRRTKTKRKEIWKLMVKVNRYKCVIAARAWVRLCVGVRVDVFVCVCVCVREREKQKERERERCWCNRRLKVFHHIDFHPAADWYRKWVLFSWGAPFGDKQYLRSFPFEGVLPSSFADAKPSSPLVSCIVVGPKNSNSEVPAAAATPARASLPGLHGGRCLEFRRQLQESKTFLFVFCFRQNLTQVSFFSPAKKPSRFIFSSFFVWTPSFRFFVPKQNFLPKTSFWFFSGLLPSSRSLFSHL